MVFEPRDKGTDISKLPLEIEALRDVRARLFVRAGGESPPFRDLDILLGAFRSKGFGRARLSLNGRAVSQEPATGELKSRVPEDEAHLLGITAIGKPLYGYLFRPNPTLEEFSIGGRYVRALLEKSVVTGYAFIVNPRKE